MKIYLVRHGQCDSNVIGRFNFVDEDINETGIKQAEDLKEKTLRQLPWQAPAPEKGRAIPVPYQKRVPVHTRS